jgi:hypothetical protein
LQHGGRRHHQGPFVVHQGQSVLSMPAIGEHLDSARGVQHHNLQPHNLQPHSWSSSRQKVCLPGRNPRYAAGDWVGTRSMRPAGRSPEGSARG